MENIKLVWQANFNISETENIVYLLQNQNDLNKTLLSEQEKKHALTLFSNGDKIAHFNHFKRYVYLLMPDVEKPNHHILEDIRKSMAKMQKLMLLHKNKQVLFADLTDNKERALAAMEGLALSAYRFLKYQKTEKERGIFPEQIGIVSKNLVIDEIDDLQYLVNAVYWCRNMVNEPVSYLTTAQMTEEFKNMSVDAGFTLEVMDKTQIENEKMGGLLAVNRGSQDPPAFHVLEYKPEDCVNKNPIVFVGKGIVFDTGGMSLKPTKDSMDYMKSDMSGAAAVASAIYYAAKIKMPLHLVGLVPATDNRPGPNAYVPGDVIQMHNGLTVEVLNTDAEGRLILADALSFATAYKPELVIELSTLTGSASVAIGKYGIVGMGNAGKKWFTLLKNAGDDCYERLVEFPFWDEYDELLKSDIADLKNVGGRDGGAITAGKFLSHFTNYPFVHLDIAGPAFVSSPDSYRGKGATGIGVRLLALFMKKYLLQKQSE